MRKLLILSSIAGLVFASSAAAASGANFSIALHPSKASKNSTLTVYATNFPSESSLPTSAEFQVQKGFKTSLKSVSQLCNPSASSCPAASQIGSGTAQVTGTFLGQNVPDTVTFAIYLGSPKQAGDIASVVVSGGDTVLHANVTGSGRLFKNSAGGLELLFDQFPAIPGLPAGTQVTIDSLSLTVGAHRTVKVRHHKVTYSLITNPSSCKGHWTGSGSVTFPSGPPITQTVTTTCSK